MASGLGVRINRVLVRGTKGEAKLQIKTAQPSTDLQTKYGRTSDGRTALNMFGGAILMVAFWVGGGAGSDHLAVLKEKKYRANAKYQLQTLFSQLMIFHADTLGRLRHL